LGFSSLVSLSVRTSVPPSMSGVFGIGERVRSVKD
jgi:hypothetical protein